jgi:hypothetical protein
MNKSFLDPALKKLLWALSYLSIGVLGRRLIIWLMQRKRPGWAPKPYEPRLWNEAYVVFALLISTMNLWIFLPQAMISIESNNLSIILGAALPMYRIAEILRTATNIIFVDREEHFAKEEDAPSEGSYYILIGNLNSWLVMILLKWIDMITCFAAITLFIGCNWKPYVQTPIDALYVNVVTMLTVGYGDIHPSASPAKLLVVVQLFCFLSYVLLVLPIVASSFKTREIKEK